MLLPAILKETKPRMKVGPCMATPVGMRAPFRAGHGVWELMGRSPCSMSGAGCGLAAPVAAAAARRVRRLPYAMAAPPPPLQVGFFLHTPFPSSEIYRTLPVREELLRSGEPGFLGLQPQAALALLAARPGPLRLCAGARLAAVAGQTAAACHSVRSACSAGGPAGSCTPANPSARAAPPPFRLVQC